MTLEQTIQKAAVLVEALPYIRAFFGKTFVIKYGGSAMPDQAVDRSLALDVVLLRYVGVRPVLVHGGGPAISEVMRSLGKEPRFVNGRRVTDADTMRIVRMVMMGLINTDIVATINRFGGKAVGLSGHDANLLVARKRLERLGPPGAGPLEGETVDLGFVGDVEAVHPEIIHQLADQGYVPVVAPIGAGYQGESYNINADSVAGELAAALKADKLLILTDVEGILEEPDNPSSLISALQVQRARRMIQEGQIAGGMVPKVEACIRALEAGVGRTHIIDGRREHSLLLEIFTDRGIGTMVVG